MTKHEGKNVTTNSNYNTIQYTIHVRSKASTQNQANKREKKIDWSKTRQDKTEYGRSSGSGSTKGIEWNKNESKTGNKASARKKNTELRANVSEWRLCACMWVWGHRDAGLKYTRRRVTMRACECMCVFWCGYFNVNRSRFDNLFSALPK